MYTLINYTFSSPVERIRGSESIRITVDATFKVANLDITVSGIALTKNDSIASLREAYKEALIDAEANLQTIIERNKLRDEAMSGLIKSLIQPQLATAKEKMITIAQNDPKVTDLEDSIARLNNPADDIRQRKIDGLCEVLGIETITVVGSWTMLEALALIEELKQKTSKFEAAE